MRAYPRCGSTAWVVERESVAVAVRWWLRHGRPRSRRCRCRACGAEGPSPGTQMVARTRGWWGAPWRVLQVLLRGLRAVPAPTTYLLIMAVGAATATAVHLALGWRFSVRWSVIVATVGSLAATWLVFLATARFQGSRRSRGPEGVAEV